MNDKFIPCEVAPTAGSTFKLSADFPTNNLIVPQRILPITLCSLTELSIFKNGKRLQWALVTSIFFLTALCYWKTVSADFVKWDDDINIYRNPHLKGVGSEQLYWMFTDFDYMRRYVPLAWLGWGLNYELDGLNPSTYH